MMRWRSSHAATILAVLVAPLAAVAQPPTGSVTTVPINNAPALGMSLCVVLALALAGIGIYRLRRPVGSRIAAFGLVAAITVLAGLGYAAAPSTITISGADCAKQTVSFFDPRLGATMVSNCTNRIQILDIQASCDGTEVNAATDINGATNLVGCTVGLILADGESCKLPICI